MLFIHNVPVFTQVCYLTDYKTEVALKNKWVHLSYKCPELHTKTQNTPKQIKKQQQKNTTGCKPARFRNPEKAALHCIV